MTQLSRAVGKLAITFKPLGGGKFRCNQTGALVKNTKRYRKMKLNEENQHYKTFSMPEVIIQWSGKASCPYCHRENRYVSIGKLNKCQNSDCNRYFLVKDGRQASYNK